MYGLSTHGSIERAHLDGSGVQALITGLNVPSGLSLDLGIDKMYWSEYYTGAINSANLDGTGVQHLFDATSNSYVDEVAVVPEPSTFALLAAGTLGLLGLRLASQGGERLRSPRPSTSKTPRRSFPSHRVRSMQRARHDGQPDPQRKIRGVFRQKNACGYTGGQKNGKEGWRKEDEWHFSPRFSILCRVAGVAAGCADVFWSNTSSGNWSNSANWVGNVLPTSTDTAWIVNVRHGRHHHNPAHLRQSFAGQQCREAEPCR